MCSSRGLFDSCSILLRHLVHLRFGSVDLFDPGSLLCGGRGNFSHPRDNAIDRARPKCPRLASLKGLGRAHRYRRTGCHDHFLDFLRCR